MIIAKSSQDGIIFRLLVCPYVLYAISWLFVLCIYSFGWTYLYPKMSLQLFLFLIITSLIALIWGISKTKRNVIAIRKIQPDYQYLKFVKKYSSVFLVFLIFEFLIERTIPLLGYFLGNVDHGAYMEFGLPFVHVFVVTGLLFCTLFCFHCFISLEDDLLRKKFRNRFLINVVMLSTIMNRAVLMYLFFGCVLLFFIAKRKVLKYVSRIILIVASVFFLFGILGNLRNGGDMEAGRAYILQIGDATPEFEKSYVPTEFLWPYLYMSSPISNVQNTIDKKKVDYSFDNFISYVVNSLMPQMISKRLNIPAESGILVTEYLTVGSVYYDSYAQFGWAGMIISFLFMFFFVEINLSLVSSFSPFYITTLVIVNIIIMFNIFDNMFIFSGLVPALVYPIYFSRKHILR